MNSKYIGALVFTIFFLLLSFIFLKFMGNFVGGVVFFITLTNSSLYWSEVIFGDIEKAKKDKEYFKTISLMALMSGSIIGLLNYLILRGIFSVTDRYIIGTLILLPIFLILFLSKLLFYMLSDNEIERYLSLGRIMLLGLLLDTGILGIGIGVTLSFK